MIDLTGFAAPCQAGPALRHLAAAMEHSDRWARRRRFGRTPEQVAPGSGHA